MQVEKTAVSIEIDNKSQVELSPSQLIAKRNCDVGQLRVGLKRTLVENTPEEAKELQKLHDDLRAQLDVRRIERLAARTLAAWSEKQQAVRLLRKDGKFESFGYSKDGKEYLEHYEALFLLELGRLQLEYHSMIMSVEQAYLLLLGEDSSEKFNEYLVFAHLSRVGYILVKYKNLSYADQQIPATSKDCIWAMLQHTLHKTPLPENIKKSPHLAKTTTDMQEIKQRTMEPIEKTEETKEPENLSKVQVAEEKFEFVLQTSSDKKRKMLDSTEQHSKRQCTTETTNCSLIDFLKTEAEYKKFESIFEKIDVIRLKSINDVEDENEQCRALKISFDLHLHNTGFRKSTPKPPTFRLIILSADETFPTHAEISKSYRTQLYTVPLLIVTISDSKQIQAFIYHFS